ncbi:MAG TPA: ATP-dependent metallopeptidase FtsH/Yme1/Tma family protein [Candidatus Acidoferrales bacterium]|nr:ATP-dependent metallopeptidase FtsH/Yme1/Tma family protein [Candidatus Acidoferrales bacterium]
MNRTLKTVVFWAVISLSAMLMWETVRSKSGDQRQPEISYSQFMSEVDAGRVANVRIRGSEINGTYRDGKNQFHLIGPANPEVYTDTLRAKGVEVWFRDANSGSLPVLGTWAPLLLLGALWFFMIRQMQRRNVPVPPRHDPGAPIEPK